MGVDGGFKATEIFRNLESAEAYYTHFLKDKMLCCYVLTNLPWRQKPGPDAVHGDGNVKCWMTNKAKARLNKKDFPQFIQYNHLKTEETPKEKVDIVEWTEEPTPAKLETEFG